MSKLLCFAVMFSLFVYCSAASKNDVVMCGQFDTYSSVHSSFSFNSNQWGDDGSGSQCISISSDVSEFNATWQWKKNSELVHAFPNIKLNSDLLPLQLSNLKSLNVTASWSMDPAVHRASTDLAEISVQANVVVDMFLDTNSSKAGSTTLPDYEVMVWMADFGGKRPIGYSSSIKHPPVYDLNGTNFTLYSGHNDNGQFVYSWLAHTNVTEVDFDISPLLHYLWQHKKMTDANYIGTVQFGSEEFHASSNVTFSTRDFNISIASGKPAAEDKNASSDATAQLFPALGLVLIPTFFAFAGSL